MNGRVGVVVIHGMGEQLKGYSAPLIEELSRRLATLAERFVWAEVLWADLLDMPEAALLSAMGTATEPDGRKLTLCWNRLRHFVVHNFGDALAYHSPAGASTTYVDIHTRISDAFSRLRTLLDDARAPVVVLAHSLGAHMMSDYLWDRQHWKQPGADPLQPVDSLSAMVSFGCNIPLFSLEFQVATPIDLPGAGVTKPALVAASRWLNFLDRSDVLGWPLRPLYEKDLARLNAAQTSTVSRIEDRAINVGGILKSWNPLSHTAYWTDDDFTKPVAAYLRTILGAVDA